MSEPIIILVGGRLTAGKDVFADRLVAAHGFVKLGMSDTLAEALYRLNPYLSTGARYQELVDRHGYVQAKTNSEVRRLLQVLGTEVGRELLGKNIWVNAVQARILEQFAAGNTKIVITGARFPNELAIAQTNFNVFNPPIITSVWVDRPSLPAADGHSSEGSVTAGDFEYVLVNSGTLEELEIASDRILAALMADYA